MLLQCLLLLSHVILEHSHLLLLHGKETRIKLHRHWLSLDLYFSCPLDNRSHFHYRLRLLWLLHDGGGSGRSHGMLLHFNLGRDIAWYFIKRLRDTLLLQECRLASFSHGGRFLLLSINEGWLLLNLSLLFSVHML
jgi:hypothetical protein